jgi:hypothetical protein
MQNVKITPLKSQVLTAYYGNLWNLLPPAPQHTFCKLCCVRTCRHRCGQWPIRSSTIGYCWLPIGHRYWSCYPCGYRYFSEMRVCQWVIWSTVDPHLVGKGLVVDVAGMQMGTIVSYPDSTHCHPYINDRRSTAGYCTFLWGNLVTWMSMIHNVFAKIKCRTQGYSIKNLQTPKADNNFGWPKNQVG